MHRLASRYRFGGAAHSYALRNKNSTRHYQRLFFFCHCVLLSIWNSAAFLGTCPHHGLRSPLFSPSVPVTKHKNNNNNNNNNHKHNDAKIDKVPPCRALMGEDDEYGYEYNDDDNDDDDDVLDDSDLNPVGIQMFLAQRTFQSFAFLLSQTRDPHTIKWIDTFLQPALLTTQPPTSSLDRSDNVNVNDTTSSSSSSSSSSLSGEGDFSDETQMGWTTSVRSDKTLSSSLLYYHGVEAINRTVYPTWDSIFRDLLDQPPTTLEIVSNNPSVPVFTIDIEPSRLCARLLSVRDQISKEWVGDLRVIASMGRSMFQSYWDHVKKGDVGIAFDKYTSFFLEATSDGHLDVKCSPLRRGNFDLLLLLTTQEALCRVLRTPNDENNSNNNNNGRGSGSGSSMKIDDNDDPVKQAANKAFLRRFYADRCWRSFRGMGKYDRANDFLAELMLCPPRMIMVDEGAGSGGSSSSSSAAKACFVDPLGIAEVVLKEREIVAKEWSTLLSETVVTGSDQLELRQLMLNRLMGI